MNIYNLIKLDKYKDKKNLEKIILHTLNIENKEIYNFYDTDLTQENINKIDKLYNELVIDKKPLEYIFWYINFKWSKFKVNKNTIIPRNETNDMIDVVNNFYKEIDYKTNLIDIWTWCGVLWISIYKKNAKKIENLILTEISTKALDIAKYNSNKILGDKKNIHFIISDLVKDINKKYFDIKTVIVANLPYIPDKTFENMAEKSTKKYEPSLAFLWWEDGLKLYKQMFHQLKNLKNISIFCEMMKNQIEILKKYFPTINIDIKKEFYFDIVIVEIKFN